MLGSRRTKPLHTSNQVSYNGSPTKATKWIQSDCSEYVNNLSAKQENINTSLDLYRTCYDNGLPQKCLKHLNFITLYCEDERKLLCVNCLYGSTLHKNHTVIPSNSSQIQIQRDNEENLERLDDEINTMQQTEKELHDNKRELESSYSFIMKEIENEYQEMHKLIQYKYEQVKMRANEEFKKCLKDNEVTGKEVGTWRKKVYDMRGLLPKSSKSEEGEVYKHLVLDTVLGEPIEAEKLTYMASREDMEEDMLAESRELRRTIEAQVHEVGAEKREKNSRRLF